MNHTIVGRRWRTYLLIPLSVLAIDLSSKYLAERTLSHGEPVRVIGDILRFTLVYNQGTTFGLFAASSAFLVISAVKLALIGTLFVCCLYVSRFIHGGRLQLISRVSLLAVVGGSFGNLIDRLMDGQVTDFVDFGFLAFRWFVFNLADAFQVIGGMTVLSFILWQSLGRRQTEA